MQRLSCCQGRFVTTAAAICVLLSVILIPGVAAAAPQIDWLNRARLLYNQKRYDQAISAGTSALAIPALANRARLVVGRAHLERFREFSTPDDLVAARAQLVAVQAPSLPPREKAELLVGFGELLYLDSQFGSAAEVFATALVGGDQSLDTRDSVIDWWATSLDRMAIGHPYDDREAIYWRIVQRMEDELGRDPGSAAASYWLAAAARGIGDLERAWNAAVAGWVRAGLSGERGPGLRTDLETLVQTAIIPERARLMAEAGPEREKAVAALKAEWDGVKERWK